MGDGGGGCLTERAFEFAYRYLARRERTVSELRQHLLGRDVDERAVEAVIEELIGQGMLDDARFAGLFVQDKRDLEQWGRERIRRALLSRGIDRELADDALADQSAGDANGGDLERALSVLRQRFPAPPEGRRERERALGLLLRKGYGCDLAIEAIHAHRRGAQEDWAA